MRTLFLTCCICFALSCSNSDDTVDPPEVSDYPKVYDNQVLTANQLDVYYHDNNSGEITFIRSQPLPPADDRTVTLLSETELDDTQHPVTIDYELVDGCVKDFRDFQRMTVSADFTLMTIDNLIIGLEEAFRPVEYLIVKRVTKWSFRKLSMPSR